MTSTPTSTHLQPFAIQTVDQGPQAGISTITLEPNQSGGLMVVLDHALIQRLEVTIKALPKNCRGLVLASGSPRVFIAGADLKSIQAPGPESSGLNDDQLDRYLAYGQRVFGMLCELPYPTAAAINGAALGGGLELAMHCDGLIGAPSSNGRSYPIGLPEAGLSICPGWGGTNLLPARMDAADAIARTAAGKPMTVEEAITANLFDRVANVDGSQDDLLALARTWVQEQQDKVGQRRDGKPSRWIGRGEFKSRVAAGFANVRASLPTTEASAAVVAAIHVGLEGGEEGWKHALDVERRELVRLRSTIAGRQAIQAFFDKSKK